MENKLKNIICMLAAIIIMTPIISFADNSIDKNKNPLEYKALKEIEEEETKAKYLELALKAVEEKLNISRSELAMKNEELSSLYSYINNAYDLKLTEEEFLRNIENDMQEEEIKKEPKTYVKSLFKYFAIIFFSIVAITVSWNFILFKFSYIKSNK